MKKRVCIDIRYLQEHPSGVGRYIRNLTEQLLLRDGMGFDFFLLGTKENFHHLGLSLSPSRTVLSPFSVQKHPFSDIWFNTFLPKVLSHKKIDLFHSTAFLAPVLKFPFRMITTIPDLVARKFPLTLPWKFRIFINSQISLAMKNADRLIAISQSVKNEIHEEFCAHPPVHVTPLACSENMLFSQKGEGASKNFPYLLCCGNLEPRKGVLDLIQGFLLFRTKNPESPIKLIFCGKKLWDFNEPEKMVRKSAFCDSIIFSGYLPENEMERLIAFADLLVVPSHYEGFGLPVLESLRAAAPVLVNDIPVFREIGGEFVSRVNIRDSGKVAEMLERLFKEGKKNEMELEKRKNYLRQFSWEKCAIKTCEVYEEALV